MAGLPPFQRLIDAHADEVMATLRGAVGAQAAEDCFQETFLAALRGYPRLRDRSNLRGWLLTIAHRKAIDHHRASGRQPLPVADVEAGGRGRALGGEAAAAEIELRDDGIWSAVGALPPKQRAAVTLRFAAELRHREIAVALGCSEAAARRSLHEGIKRLRKELA